MPLKDASEAAHLHPPPCTSDGETMHEVVAQSAQSQVGATEAPVLPIHTVWPVLLVTVSWRSPAGQVPLGVTEVVGVAVAVAAVGVLVGVSVGGASVAVAVAVAAGPAGVLVEVAVASGGATGVSVGVGDAVAVALAVPVGMPVGVAVAVAAGVPTIWQASP